MIISSSGEEEKEEKVVTPLGYIVVLCMVEQLAVASLLRTILMLPSGEKCLCVANGITTVCVLCYPFLYCAHVHHVVWMLLQYSYTSSSLSSSYHWRGGTAVVLPKSSTHRGHFHQQKDGQGGNTCLFQPGKVAVLYKA